ncbi:hypothetical protein [Azospirillum sp. B506]|uniref:hypothetical protein n=1 Tax=Azospirillum sp. B506 TaxID=137721 RepID=UPI0005B2B59C|nr:hypothetical protein [Azospirillum sp. B506]
MDGKIEIISLANELSAAAGINEEQALAVLKILHVDRLDQKFAGSGLLKLENLRGGFSAAGASIFV